MQFLQLHFEQSECFEQCLQGHSHLFLIFEHLQPLQSQSSQLHFEQSESFEQDLQEQVHFLFSIKSDISKNDFILFSSLVYINPSVLL